MVYLGNGSNVSEECAMVIPSLHTYSLFLTFSSIPLINRASTQQLRQHPLVDDLLCPVLQLMICCAPYSSMQMTSSLSSKRFQSRSIESVHSPTPLQQQHAGISIMTRALSPPMGLDSQEAETLASLMAARWPHIPIRAPATGR